MNNNLPNPVPCKCNGDGQIVKKFLKDQSNLSWPKYIPGPTGPAGPAGPEASLSNILIVNETTQEVAVDALVLLGTEINSVGTELVYDVPSTITITEAGTYLIDFSSLITSAGVAGDLGATLEINGITVLSASKYIPSTTTPAYSVELIHSYNATPGDKITISNKSAVANDFYSPTLLIIKLA